ncbi:uncharacterized protein PpBr36_10702 [Pyricularia pennisetigena]|uniref:uncharacterized protein n=1 Tax=Pyricularia pennisetigena TaxID=1578925 RepID=UPI001153DF9A|nr:uncharacterized protein PpBr36_10702 [Pyricularia pennisetigena]TLS21038.1 hypothetical protein PpBr36_10702 [Pyricularia pennisetigena]
MDIATCVSNTLAFVSLSVSINRLWICVRKAASDLACSQLSSSVRLRLMASLTSNSRRSSSPNRHISSPSGTVSSGPADMMCWIGEAAPPTVDERLLLLW